MTTPHPRPWHRDSVFGDGPRRPLDREQRARFRFLLNAHRRARRLTATHEIVGNALVRRLGVDGQLDPSHDTIAADVGCASRTVRRALDALKTIGLLIWQRRLVRDGWRTSQTSNAYALAMTANPPATPPVSCGGQSDRQTRKEVIHPVQQSTAADVRAAQAALAERRRVIEARIADKVISKSVSNL
jgi:hypothetical protein